jgi:hypothetical protein
VLDPVDRLGGLAGGELGVGGDVGGPGDVVLVPGHQDVVLGRDQVGLDVVGAQLDGQPVGGQGVLGPVAAGPAVADDQRQVPPAALAALVDPLLAAGGSGHLAQGEDEQGGGQEQGRGASRDPAHGRASQRLRRQDAVP